MNKKVIILTVIILITILFNIGFFLHTNKSSLENSTTHNFEEFSIASGVVPHHLVAREIIENFFQYLSSKGRPQNIILLSPDHFNATNLVEKSFISVDSNTKEFHNLAVNNYLLQKLNNHDLAFDDSAVNLDHGITALLPYIKKYSPESSILPIIISSVASKENVEKLIKTINVYN